MSRSYKVSRDTFKKVPDKVHPYKCDCSWCVASKLRYQKLGNDMFNLGISEMTEEMFDKMRNIVEVIPVTRLTWEQYFATVTSERDYSKHTIKALKKFNARLV
ncbi:hypothetical protein [Yersinia phage vB_YenM_P778]